VKTVLIANRGEVAIRIARAVAEAGLQPVSVFAEDDASALHARIADAAYPLRGAGPRAYLDIDQLLEIAAAAVADAVHPGYGFLSESAAFARRSAEAGLTFVGPAPETLERFGDKGEARRLAAGLGVPVIEGVEGGAGLEAIATFREALGHDAAIMVKAVSGGGGLGIRRVEPHDDLAAAYDVCAREAQSAFGDARLYAERLVRSARHIEVQVAGDGRDVVVFGDRDCSIQRRRQKIIEVAPAPKLEPGLRARLAEWALTLARAVGLTSLATIEFLVDAED
jgi:acetyl/propionyl-CoA carboxylase alpha subunit